MVHPLLPLPDSGFFLLSTHADCPIWVPTQGWYSLSFTLLERVIKTMDFPCLTSPAQTLRAGEIEAQSCSC